MNNLHEESLAEKIARVRDTIKTYPKSRRIFLRKCPEGYEPPSPGFNAPLTDEQLREFEQAYQIQIPDEYRAFITSIGDGETEGTDLPLARLALTAPDYRQILTTGHIDYVHPRFASRNWSVDCTFLKQPFPFEKPWQPRDRKQFEKQEQKYSKLYFRGIYIQGSLMIWHGGCGYYTYLVVSGNDRGNVWLSDPNSHWLIPYQPDEKDPTSRCGFLDWYVTWLKNGWM